MSEGRKMFDFERQLFEGMSMEKRKRLAKQLSKINSLVGLNKEVKYK
jgi:hypothetical protein